MTDRQKAIANLLSVNGMILVQSRYGVAYAMPDDPIIETEASIELRERTFSSIAAHKRNAT